MQIKKFYSLDMILIRHDFLDFINSEGIHLVKSLKIDIRGFIKELKMVLISIIKVFHSQIHSGIFYLRVIELRFIIKSSGNLLVITEPVIIELLFLFLVLSECRFELLKFAKLYIIRTFVCARKLL